MPLISFHDGNEPNLLHFFDENFVEKTHNGTTQIKNSVAKTPIMLRKLTIGMRSVNQQVAILYEIGPITASRKLVKFVV